MKIAGVGDNVVDCNYTTGIMYPGGNSVNFAVFGKQIGCDSSYIGVVGDDREGELILNALNTKDVDTSRCVRRTGETGRCGIHLKDGDRTIVEENDKGVVKSNPLLITDELMDFLKTCDLVHSSCYSCLEDQLKKMTEAGIPVLYDFSDEWTAERFAAICPDIRYAFFSGKDLADEELERYLRKIVTDYDCQLAITTIGSRGALVYDGIKIYHKKPYNFAGGVVDTTGAGDSWIVGFMTTYLSNQQMLEQLQADHPENYLTPKDLADYQEQLIEVSMCAGNLLARRNCLIQGSFGCGVSMEQLSDGRR